VLFNERTPVAASVSFGTVYTRGLAPWRRSPTSESSRIAAGRR
jgi:hypothetical protein